MRTLKTPTLFLLLVTFTFISCTKDPDVLELSAVSSKGKGIGPERNSKSFQLVQTIGIGGEGAAEISAFDPSTNKLFTVNSTIAGVNVYDLSDLGSPVPAGTITGLGGAPTSVASNNKGIIAVAVEADPSQDPGSVLLFDAETLSQIGNTITVGPLPDMVTFTPDGTKILVANEGEPNDDWSNDPEGSVSIIDYPSLTVTTADFSGFTYTDELKKNGFRVFGPDGSDLSLPTNVEPEYIAVSDDSKVAWVSLQENNGLARVNIEAGTIEDIYPLGFKDYSDPFNSIDPSDRDGIKTLRTVPAFGMYQPDAIAYANIKGQGIIVTANEGDARGYDAFDEEARVQDLILDPTAFPNAADLQLEENLGRLEITTTLGDTDGDGDYDELFSYGARSFSIWSETGQLIFDSGNDIGEQTLRLTPDRFNDNDNRSDAKGGEPEAVVILQLRENKWLLFVGLERNDQVLVYDISNPYRPRFLQILSNIGVDEAPEGLLVISEEDSPTGKALLIVSNEDSGTVSIYQNGALDL